LLSSYNDGRRKTLYCLAVNLLLLQDTENALNQISEDETFKNLPTKAQADYITSLFQNMAMQ